MMHDNVVLPPNTQLTSVWSGLKVLHCNVPQITLELKEPSCIYRFCVNEFTLLSRLSQAFPSTVKWLLFCFCKLHIEETVLSVKECVCWVWWWNVWKDTSQHASWTHLTFDNCVHFMLMGPSLCIAVSSWTKKKVLYLICIVHFWGCAGICWDWHAVYWQYYHEWRYAYRCHF